MNHSFKSICIRNIGTLSCLAIEHLLNYYYVPTSMDVLGFRDEIHHLGFLRARGLVGGGKPVDNYNTE